MNFHSYGFLFLFLPVCVAGFWLLRYRCRKKTGRVMAWWLILLSFVFYGCGSVRSLLPFGVSLAVNYFLLQGIWRKPSRAKILMRLGVVFNLAMLAWFKYYNFLGGIFGVLFGESFAARNLLLPLGISYLTFQQIALLVDAERGELFLQDTKTKALTEQKEQKGQKAAAAKLQKTIVEKVQKPAAEKAQKPTAARRLTLTDYLLYITFFPKLLLGPITRYRDLEEQFAHMETREWDSERFVRGGMLLILGLAKECLLSQNLQTIADFAFSNSGSLTFLEAYLGVFCYMLQLYFDFSAYCDMGRGVCRMMGLDLPANFHEPLHSIHIVDFWKRWHRTLTGFLTRYVYIPLGGNRRGKVRMCLNILIIFLLSGLWHGAAWTYVLWGLLQGIIFIPVKLLTAGKKKKMAAPLHLLCRIAHQLALALTFVIFRAANVQEAVNYYKIMLESLLKGSGAWKMGTSYLKLFQIDELWYIFKGLHLGGWSMAPILCMLLFLGIAVYFAMFSREASYIAEHRRITVPGAVIYAVLLVWSVFSFAGVSTFVYVNF